MGNDDPELGMRGSAHVPNWLRQSDMGLALTTYQTHRLLLLGVDADGTLSGFERIFDRPMGLHASADGTRLTMATRYQIRELVDALPAGDTHDGYDRVYVPRRAVTTGELDAHDLHRAPDGTLLFANTRFSCLATTSDTHSFRVVWTPPFISQVSPEDRCHLNGLAVDDGTPRYATAVSRSDVAAGWRDRREGNGVVLDVQSGELVADGLTMPHSPRLHNDTLYLINAGTGELGRIDRDAGTFEPIAFCPGFGRGLAFHDDRAIVGLSKPRGDELFQDLPLGHRLQENDASPRCGLFVIDLTNGSTAHWLEFTGGIVEELYDVQVLPNTTRPMALGFKTDEIRRFITVEHDDVPQRFQIALTDPQASKTTSDGASPSGALPSLELPEAARQSARAPEESSYRVRADVITAGEALDRFEPLLPNRLPRQIHAGQIDAAQPLMTVVGTRNKEAVGLAAARPLSDGETVELEALHVLPGHRGQGLGTSLLKQLERFCARQERDKMKAEYRSDFAHQATLERIFEKRGWGVPKVQAHTFKVIASDVAEHPGLARPELLNDGDVVSWASATQPERDAIRQQVQARQDQFAFPPFQKDDMIAKPASVVLRTADGSQGCAIVHRAAEDALQLTALYVHPSIRRKGAGLHLLVEALHRQHEATSASKTLFAVDPQNDAMRSLVTDHLDSVLASHARLLVVGTRLAPR